MRELGETILHDSQHCNTSTSTSSARPVGPCSMLTTMPKHRQSSHHTESVVRASNYCGMTWPSLGAMRLQGKQETRGCHPVLAHSFFAPLALPWLRGGIATGARTGTDALAACTAPRCPCTPRFSRQPTKVQSTATYVAYGARSGWDAAGECRDVPKNVRA